MCTVTTGSSQPVVTPCLSSLGYEVECITPVDDEPASGTGQEPLWNASGDEGLSGLDVLSCVASSQVHQDCSTSQRRRFSILDLPLSQFIDAVTAADGGGSSGGDGRKISSSPDVISSGYNVPSAGDCVASTETMSMSSLIQRQNSGGEVTTEQRTGDVFAALKVDVGQYCV